MAVVMMLTVPLLFGVVRAWWWAQAELLLLAVGLTWHILSYATLRRPE